MTILIVLTSFFLKILKPVLKYCSSTWVESHHQASSVLLSIGSTLVAIQQLGDEGMTAREIRIEYKRLVLEFTASVHRLDGITAKLPLVMLLSMQNNVLFHARWLANYLHSHITDNEEKFFLFRWDMSSGNDKELQKLIMSLKQ